LITYYPIDTLYILLTEKAENGIPQGATESNWQVLQKLLAGKVELIPIRIPDGNSSSDIWTIFEKLTECLKDQDRVIFDITLGFRSLPILALIVVTFLRVVRQVKIEGLIYGAFEARNADNETPIFDLMPIVSLLEWTTATDQFIKTGNAQALATLLQDTQDEQLQELSININSIAQGLELLRPFAVMQEAVKLGDKINVTSSDIVQKVPPFMTLLKRIEQEYGDFALADPLERVNFQSSLCKQLKIIKWYLAKEQIVQALSLTREWLPSFLCYHFNLDILDKYHREEMEFLLSGGTQKDSAGNVIKQSPYLDAWAAIDKKKTKPLRTLWNGDLSLANLRNDVLHAGHRKNAKSAKKIIETTALIVQELDKISQSWDLFRAC